MKPTYTILSLSLLVVSGCATSASFTKLNDNAYPAKPSTCPIAVLTEDPKEAFDQIGYITASSGQTFWAGKDLQSMLPAMKEKACAVGADALILKHVEEGGVAWIKETQGKASAVAIKYVSKPAASKNP